MLVALVPTSGGSIPMKNPKVIQVELQKASSLFQKITEVRQFGRGGILCCSADQDCVRELLNCSEFAAQPVSPFIPAHLACTKGIVRGVDTSLTPQEILDLFAVAGAVSVYRCTRTTDKTKSPTESVIVTFAGRVRPTEIKAWPLIYKVEPLSPKPLQCSKCWRFGHSMKGCRSQARCRLCGESHDSCDCKSDDQKCCLCNGAHPADSAECGAKEREMGVLEIIERRRCSRREAVAEMHERSKGYAGITSRHTAAMDASLAKSITEAIEKSTEKAMQRLAATLFEALADMLTQQLTQIIGTVSVQNRDSHALLISRGTEEENQTVNHRSISPKAGPSKNRVQAESEPVTDDSGDFTDMDTESLRTLKRNRSPPSKKSSQNPKSKKYLSKKDFFENLSKNDFLKKDILDQAVSSAGIASK